nr:putative mitochondrial protein [Tanacetum cinerariifolium]
LTDRNEALMMFQNFAMGEPKKINNNEGASASGSRNGDQNEVKKFFILDNVRDENKLRFSMHLYDKALYWHQQFVKINGDNVSWNVYVKEIMSRFGDVYEDPLVELKNLKQDGEVKKYQEKFKELWN